jgi:MFS family permease
MATDNSYINALVGAVVTVVLSFVPFAPLLGGATAGFLERRDGGRIGFISGAFATLPMLAVAVFAGLLLGFLGFGNVFNALVLFVFAVLLVGVYTVVCSTLGGVVGVYLAEEYRDRERRA